MPRMLLVPVVLAVVCGCTKQPVSPRDLPPVQVAVLAAHAAPAPLTEDVVGTVRAAVHAMVSAKISATIEALNAVPGQSVTAGFVLATLNAREIRARRDQAVAALDQAQQSFTRIKALYEQKINSQQEFQTASNNLRTAQAGLDEAASMLAYTEVRAPFNGVITRKLMDQGDLAAPGSPLVEIDNPSLLRLEAEVPEAAISRIKLGDRFPVSIDAALIRTNAVVSEIAPVANPVSRTFLVKLDLPHAAHLYPGQFGRVSVPVGEQATLMVPAGAVLLRGQLEYVFAVQDARAIMRIVRTGRRTADAVEILAGLSDGDRVVINGADRLRDGQPVTVAQ
jgi:RND family efflux transporter MFP subunit